MVIAGFAAPGVGPAAPTHPPTFRSDEFDDWGKVPIAHTWANSSKPAEPRKMAASRDRRPKSGSGLTAGGTLRVGRPGG